MVDFLKRLLIWFRADDSFHVTSHPKHRFSWQHPIAACFVHYTICAVVIVTFYDFLFVPFMKWIYEDSHEMDGTLNDLSFLMCAINEDDERARIFAARVSLGYVTILLMTRLLTNTPGVHKYSVLYEFCWLCNSSLVFGAFGLYSCRPLIATGFAVAVSIDQLLWYVDIIGYILSGMRKFPIGVCKYLFWKNTQWSSRISCTHHFWTIPIMIYGCSGLKCWWGSWLLNIVLVLLHVLLARWLTPFKISLSKEKGNVMSEESQIKYLNVNLCYELWGDIKVGILRRAGDNQPTFVYILRLNLWWQLFNLCCVMFLYGMESFLRKVML